MILPPSQNTVAVCYRIPLILYFISSQLVTLLKITDAHIQASDICDLTVALMFINCSFQIFLIFVPEMSSGFTSYNVCLCRVYKSMHLLVRRGVCETQLANMDFSTSSFQVLTPMQFSNSLLLSHYTFFHSACPVVQPWRMYPSGLQISFPIPQVPHLNTIINRIISSKFP